MKKMAEGKKKSWRRKGEQVEGVRMEEGLVWEEGTGCDDRSRTKCWFVVSRRALVFRKEEEESRREYSPQKEFSRRPIACEVNDEQRLLSGLCFVIQSHLCFVLSSEHGEGLVMPFFPMRELGVALAEVEGTWSIFQLEDRDHLYWAPFGWADERAECEVLLNLSSGRKEQLVGLYFLDAMASLCRRWYHLDSAFSTKTFFSRR
jgi:hypothetical protein